MPAKRIALSLSEEALRLLDRFAAEDGLSRSAWFEREVWRAERGAFIAKAVRLSRRSGIAAAPEAELDGLRRELAAGQRRRKRATAPQPV